MKEKKKDVIRLEREAVIPILKHKLTTALSLHFAENGEREEFLRFCQRVECTIRAWYHLHFEDLMQLYSLFEPVRGALRLQQQNLSPHEIDVLEHQFLQHLFEVMEKSNFKVITNEEIQVALSAQYRLNLPIVVNEAKLDTKLLTRFFSKFPRHDLPHFADKTWVWDRSYESLLLPSQSGYHPYMPCFSLKGLVYGKKEEGLSEQIDISIETEKDSLYIERIRIEKLNLSLSNLMKKITIQEPTFERIIVVYRRVSGKKESERNIYVKHFKSIPMADMEIVLPEKKNPGLTPLDWVKFLVSAAIGLVKTQRHLQVLLIRKKYKIKMKEKKKDVIRLEREAVIPILKHKLTTALSLHFAENGEREEFLRFCQRVECTIRAWYHLHFEDLMQLYSLFEPVRGALRLQQQNLSPHEIDVLEHQFLQHLFEVMEKSNFKVITNEEIQVALSAQYRLNLPIVVNEAKLDTKLLTRFFSKFPRHDLPHFADKYIIFRRGFGIDHMKAYFFLAKVDTILVRIWMFLLTITCLKGLVYGKKEEGLSEQIDISIETEKDSLYIERIRIEKLNLSLSNLMKKITIQEPTFERIIVVYRRVSGKKESERNIYVKHFKSIPMADMEIVLVSIN
ncbi:hypothetical protein F2Q68_00007313 [Brassica cretica]|uniref:Uncharacterized protein n=1 Tax=Brassica cretica TaxID=69181 RepID=A0A8S9L031_BRACR|nr:hypothetical protein F2Q68_00007313 [Brassica cretica]